MSVLPHKKTTKGYPYRIPVFPEARLPKKPDLWNALEFLRAEALLRSSIVHKMYSARKKNDEKFRTDLMKRFGVGYNVLKGEHHNLLEEKGTSFQHLTSEWYQREVSWSHKLKADGIDYPVPELHTLLSESHSLIISVPRTAPPERVIKELRPFLKENFKRFTGEVRRLKIGVKDGRRWASIPGHPYKAPPLKEIKTWIDYLKCYDLSVGMHVLSNREIGMTVFPNKSKDHARLQARVAINRVRRLIQLAETNSWPPPSGLFKTIKPTT